MVQTAPLTFPLPQLHPWDAADIVEFGVRDTPSPLSSHFHAAPSGFIEYASQRIIKRCIRPLLSAPVDKLEERFLEVLPHFSLSFTTITGAIAVALDGLSSKQREEAEKAMESAVRAVVAHEAPRRIGSSATSALLGSMRTVSLIKRASRQSSQLTFETREVESALLGWALAFSAIIFFLSEQHSRGKTNAMSLSFRVQDFADSAYHAVKKAGILKPARPPGGMVYYEPTEEDMLLAKAASQSGADILYRMENEN